MSDSDDDVPLNIKLPAKSNQDDYDEESDDIPLGSQKKNGGKGKGNGKEKENGNSGGRSRRNVKAVSYKETDGGGEEEDSDDMVLTATGTPKKQANGNSNTKKRKASAISKKAKTAKGNEKGKGKGKGKGKEKGKEADDEEDGDDDEDYEEDDEEDEDDPDDDDDIPLSSKRSKTTTATKKGKRTAATKAKPKGKVKGKAKTSKKKGAGTKGKKTTAKKKATTKGDKKATKAAAKGKGKGGNEKLESTEKTIFSKKAERIELAIKAFKWWDVAPLAEGIQWKKLEHNGMSFPPNYKCHGIPFTYDGVPVGALMKVEVKEDDNGSCSSNPISSGSSMIKKEEGEDGGVKKEKEGDMKKKVGPLPADIEELATFFAGFPADGPQLGNPEVAPTFIKNFFEEFKKATSNRCVSKVTGAPIAIKDFAKCGFDAIRSHLDVAKQVKKAATDSEKERAKMDKANLQDKFGYALLDNRIEKVGNYNMEPAGLFRGRGVHPKCGMLKKRAMPEQVTINIGPYAKAPICPIPGHAWGSLQHDNRVTWMSSWKENVLEGNKYVQMAASGSFKGKSDMEKYDKAARLKDYIGKIRADYEKALVSKDREQKQRATAMWIIDKLALRVGGEKGDDEADTVGCCSLRKEHFTFPLNADQLYADSKKSSSNSSLDDNNSTSANGFEVELEFLGKDSMLFKQTIDFTIYGVHGIQVWKNLYTFMKGKKDTDEVFDSLTPTLLNQHLSSLMPGLSAKVFRTYNASETLQNELPTTESMMGMLERDKVVAYNEANRKVAILCNHQRTASKATETSIDGLKDKLKLLKKQKKEIASWKDLVKSKKGTKSVTLKSNHEEKAQAEKITKAVEAAEKKKQKAITDEEKVEATAMMESAKAMKKDLATERLKSAHLFVNEPSADQVSKRLDTWTEKIKKLELDIRNKDENKEVALGTSKINYMDPRISVAWCKRNEVTIEKVFAKTLREKFVWAMSVRPTWRFEGEKERKKELLNAASTTSTTSNSSSTTAKKIKNEEKEKEKEKVKDKPKDEAPESDDDIPLGQHK